MSRIELAAGSFGMGASIGSLQTDFSSLIAKSENVIGSFAVVKSKTRSISGGVGNLQGALDDIEARISLEEDIKEDIQSVQKKTNEFIELTISKDKVAAETVNKNQEDLFRRFPELRPAETEEERAWYEEAWEWLCEKGEEIKEGIKAAVDVVKDTVKKAFNGIISFYQENKELIHKILDTVLIIVGVIGAIAAVIATGGLALVPLLSTFLPMAIATAISLTVAAVAVISTVLASSMNLADTWMEIDNENFTKWQNALNITSAITNGFYSIGNMYNSLTGVDGKEFIARRKAIENGKQGYDLDEISKRFKIGEGRDFSKRQKDLIRQENMRRNGGVLRDDLTGKKGVIYDPRKGGPKPPNALEVDHILAKTKGGSNSFSNARLINAPTNLAKSNSLDVPLDFVIDMMPDTPNIPNFFKFGIGGNIGGFKGYKLIFDYLKGDEE